MLATASSNGVFQIGRKGRRKVAFGENEPFEVDVVAVYNQWYVLRAAFCDDTKLVPVANQLEWDKAEWQFIVDLTKTEQNPTGCGDLTQAEAKEFMNFIFTEKETLESFFAPKSLEKQSLPESIELRLSEG